MGTPHKDHDWALPIGPDIRRGEDNNPPCWYNPDSDPIRWIEYISSGGLDLRWADLQGVNLLDFDLRDAKLDFAILHNHPKSSVSGYAPPWPPHDGIDVRNEGVSPKLPEKHLLIWKIVNGFYSILDPQKKGQVPISDNKIFQCEYDLRGSDLSNAVFSDTHLGRSVGPMDTQPYRVYVNMRKANLERANLSRSFFRGGRLDGANLEESDLSYARLNGCVFQRGANLRKANLSYSELQGANFLFSDLSYANLSWAKGLGDPYDFKFTEMTGAHLYGQIGYKIRLLGARIDERAYDEMLEDDETYGVEHCNPNEYNFERFEEDWEGVLNVAWEVDGTLTECIQKKGLDFDQNETVGIYQRFKTNGDVVTQHILDWGTNPWEQKIPLMRLTLHPSYDIEYIGEHENFIPHGFGCWNYPDGLMTIEGTFVNGEMSGVFRFSDPDSDLYNIPVRLDNGKPIGPDAAIFGRSDPLVEMNYNPLNKSCFLYHLES